MGTLGFRNGKITVNGVTKIAVPTKVSPTSLNVNGVVLDLNSDLIVPYSKTEGTDYYFTATYLTGDRNDANVLGGFHYGLIPEGFTAINNITTVDATDIRGINKYSIWTKWSRAICGDNRGMIRCLTGKWYDIYLLNTDHHLYGTSAAGKTIAGGSISNGRNYPKIPLFYGGDGTVTYGTLTWFEAAEIGKAYGKDLISYEEFAAIAYGVLEASSAGAADTGVTQHLANYTSKFGMCMATGCQYIWGKDLIGPAGAAWNTNTEGRGSIYNASLIPAVFGGYRDYTVESGSRCSGWNNYVWNTSWSNGSRYACDHLEVE